MEIKELILCSVSYAGLWSPHGKIPLLICLSLSWAEGANSTSALQGFITAINFLEILGVIFFLIASSLAPPLLFSFTLHHWSKHYGHPLDPMSSGMKFRAAPVLGVCSMVGRALGDRSPNTES